MPFIVKSVLVYSFSNMHLDRIVQVLDLIDEHLQRALSVDAPRNVHSALQHVGEGGSGRREAVMSLFGEVELKLVLLGPHRQHLLLPVDDDVLREESHVLHSISS